jgi:predicted amidohydrolase
MMLIATAQSPISADVRCNGRFIRELMQQARDHGARIVHFAEGALSGYSKSEVRDWTAFDWAAIREQLTQIASSAREFGIWVVVGCSHRLSEPHRPHNSLYVISDAGVIIGRYDKRFCSNNEINNWYSPGFEPLMFHLDGFKFGCALCIDAAFPEVFAEYERYDVDCVFLSAYSGDPRYATMLRGHAAINSLWISISTPAQCSSTLPSGLIDPDGELLSVCDATGLPAVAIGRLEKADYEIALSKARPWRRTAREGTIYRSRRVRDHRSANKAEI